MQNTTERKKKTVVRNFENDLSNTVQVIKVKVELLHHFEKSYNETVIDFNFSRLLRSYLPSKVISAFFG